MAGCIYFKFCNIVKKKKKKILSLWYPMVITENPLTPLPLTHTVSAFRISRIDTFPSVLLKNGKRKLTVLDEKTP